MTPHHFHVSGIMVTDAATLPTMYDTKDRATMTKIALYPGSFDPITNGHINILERGLEIFDVVHVGVLNNSAKTPLFSVEERLDMIRACFPDTDRVVVGAFDGLLVDYAHKVDASCILRGLRAVADFEYEYQMANMNRLLNHHIETVFLMATPETFFVSSRMVKEVATLGGEIEKVVPANIKTLILNKLGIEA